MEKTESLSPLRKLYFVELFFVYRSFGRLTYSGFLRIKILSNTVRFQNQLTRWKVISSRFEQETTLPYFL